MLSTHNLTKVSTQLISLCTQRIRFVSQMYHMMNSVDGIDGNSLTGKEKIDWLIHTTHKLTRLCLDERPSPSSVLSSSSTSVEKDKTRQWGPGYYQSWIGLGDKDASAAAVISHYHFIVIAERFDESMVVLKHKLGLKFSDLFYIKAKCATCRTQKAEALAAAAASNDTNADTTPVVLGWLDEHKGRFRVPLDGESRELVEYLQGKLTNDKEIYRLALQQLDREIDAIGRDVFSQDLSTFRGYLEQVWSECQSYTPKKCYWNDAGCYYDCMDLVAEREGW